MNDKFKTGRTSNRYKSNPTVLAPDAEEKGGISKDREGGGEMKKMGNPQNRGGGGCAGGETNS